MFSTSATRDRPPYVVDAGNVVAVVGGFPDVLDEFGAGRVDSLGGRMLPPNGVRVPVFAVALNTEV